MQPLNNSYQASIPTRILDETLSHRHLLVQMLLGILNNKKN
uniref:Uncharacterized protein n=1 Tax=Rhizophora mucronata TaxID=61149 RepID=A0A2P2NTX9_RHIMU